MKKGEIYERLDEEERPIKFIVLDLKILEDGTIIRRSKSMPLGVVSLECGHKTPIFNYDFAEWTAHYCFRCNKKQPKVEIEWRWLK